MDVGKEILYWLCLAIDRVVYSLISVIYQVFELLSYASLYTASSASLNTLVKRIYVILGVVMLFVLAYNIILLIMDPDKFSSGGDKSLQGILKNLVISVVLITALPTIFTYMTNLQNSIIKNKVLSKIVLGGPDGIKDKCKGEGTELTLTLFSTFFHPVNDNGEGLSYYDCLKNPDSSEVCDDYIRAYDNACSEGSLLKLTTNKNVFSELMTSSNNGHANMEYYFLISTIAGCIALLMFVSYSIDIGMRVAKLAILQIIAPIPVILRITKPSGGIYSKWLDMLINTYLMLFIRLITIYFAIFTIDLVIDGLGTTSGGIFANATGEYSGTIRLFAYMFVIIGILLFAKEAPDLLSKFTGGTGVGGFGLGSIWKKLSDAGNTAASVPILGRPAAKGFGALTGGLGALDAQKNNIMDLRSRIQNEKDPIKRAELEKQLSNLNYRDAWRQGSRTGWVKGKNQFSSAANDIWYNHHDYNEKMGLFGQSFDSRIANEYKNYEDKNFKENLKNQYEAERNQADMDIQNRTANLNRSDMLKYYDDANGKIKEFENSSIYKNAASNVDEQIRNQNLTVSSDERAAMINKNIQSIRENTTDNNVKRQIDSYTRLQEITTEIENGLTPDVNEINKVAKEKNALKVSTMIKNAGNLSVSSNFESLISDANTRNLLTNQAQALASEIIKNTSITLSVDEQANIRNNTIKVAVSDINAVGGMKNITLSTEMQANIDKNLTQVASDIIAKAGGAANIKLDINQADLSNKINAKFDALVNDRKEELINAKIGEIVSSKPGHGATADDIKQIRIDLETSDEYKEFRTEIVGTLSTESAKLQSKASDIVINEEAMKQVKSEKYESVAQEIYIESKINESNANELKKKQAKFERDTLIDKLVEVAQSFLEKATISETTKEVSAEYSAKGLQSAKDAAAEYEAGRVDGLYSNNISTGEVDDMFIAGADLDQRNYKKDDKYKKYVEAALKQFDEDHKK